MEILVHTKRRIRTDLLLELGIDVSLLSGWVDQWQGLKDTSKQRGHSFNLSFDEYMRLVKDAGLSHHNQIGKSIDSYQMGRIGDIGPYSSGNCRFITKRQNQIESKENGRTNLIWANRAGANKSNDMSIAAGALKQSKNFRLTSPNGEVFVGRNLTEFCHKNNLNRGEMSSVCAGKVKHHKGWVGEYI